MAVAVLMLQALPGQSGAAGGATQEEAARAHVGACPDQVSNALETKHRVKDEKWNGIDGVGSVSGASSDEGRGRARFGDAFLQDLPVLGFLVVEQCVPVHRLIELPDVGVNAQRTEQLLHAEGACLVWKKRHQP